MKYLLVYGNGNKSKSFENKSELLGFIKNRFDKVEYKSYVENIFYADKNIINLTWIDDGIYVGVPKNENQFEITKNLYYDIGLLLGCISRII